MDENGTSFGGVWIGLLFIFLIILFWGNNGNRGYGNYGGFGFPFNNGFGGLYDGWQTRLIGETSSQIERSLTSVGNQMNDGLRATNGQLGTMMTTMLEAQYNTADRVIDAQRDQRIQQLQQENLQQFIVSQNEQTRQLVTIQGLQQDNERLKADAALNSRLQAIEMSMLKQPSYIPFGGTPAIGCSNIPSTSTCGCNA